jgi:hypothetical protein
MTNANTSLSTEDANRFRAFERQRHDNFSDELSLSAPTAILGAYLKSR